MRKISSIVMIFIAAIILIACDKKEKEEVIPKDLVIDSPLVFSKVMSDEFFEATAIEIYNPSDKVIDLKYHFIDIYQASNRNRDTRIKLEGTIGAKEFFLVAHEDANSEIKELSDQAYKGRQITGSEAIVLVAAFNEIDNIGLKGSGLTYIFNQIGGTLVRRPDKLVQRKSFVYSDYIEFLPKQYEMLGKKEIGVADDDFIYGPKLTDEDRSLPFYLNGKKGLGGGGVTQVELTSYNDGDTPKLKFDTNLGIDNSKGTRLYFIDTPETQSTRIEEYGLPAANFTNNLIQDAIKNDLLLEVQTPNGLSTDGGFGRFFGHLYVDGYSVSYLLLRNGLAKSGVNSKSEESSSTYKGMTLESWMRQAYFYSEDNGLGIHNEDKLDASYFYNSVNEGNNVGNRPFFKKWYEREGYITVSTEDELKNAVLNDVKNIELENDIVLTDTLQFNDKSNIRINGFLKSITLKNATKSVISVANSTNINFENIKFNGGKNGIDVTESSIVINGVIEFDDIIDSGIKVMGKTSTVKQGSNSDEEIKGGQHLKFVVSTSKTPIIKSDVDNIFESDMLFNNQEVVKNSVEETFVWLIN